MNTSPMRLVALLLPALLIFRAGAVAPPAPNVERLVEQLGSDDFNEREAASKRLVEIGEPALDALHKATKSDDLEVRRRASRVVSAVENRLYGPKLCLTGHTDAVFAVCVSADGKRVLTGSVDRTLRLWDADTGKCLRVFEGHTARVVGAVLSPDGRRVLSGSDDRSVRLWDADTGKEIRKMTGHTDAVDGVAFGPEGQALSGGSDGTMRLWDLKTGKQARVFTGHTGRVREVAYSEKARLAATGGLLDRSIRLWDLETGKTVRTLTGHTDLVASVCFSPDGKRLLSSSFDGTLRIWDVQTGKELKRLTSACLHGSAFSPDGKRIVSGGFHDRTVRVWDAATGKELRTYAGHTGSVVGVTFFPDGKCIASASADGTARVWRAPR